jgi:histidinol phosphatase-like enzyme
MLTVEEFDSKQKIENSKNIAIDFDGVIHKCSRGYFDGTVYDDPIDGSLDSLRKIKNMGYNIVIFSCKSRSDRPKVNGIDGTQMIWEWLAKHGVDHLVSDVVSEKPRAAIFIDDKGYRFQNWEDTIAFVENLK